MTDEVRTTFRIVAELAVDIGIVQQWDEELVPDEAALADASRWLVWQLRATAAWAAQITLGLYQTLVVLVPSGWEPMLTVTDTDARAWVRSKVGPSRIIGKLRNTAEEAVLSLLAKLQKQAGL